MCACVRLVLNSVLQNLQVSGGQQSHPLHVGAHRQQHGYVLGQPGARSGEWVLSPQPPAFGVRANARGGERA